jgi:hypothetical protein
VEAAMSEQTQEKEKREPNEYRVFRNLGDDNWRDLGVVTATGVSNARREAVKEFDLAEHVRNGGLELAVVANRFWRPKEGGIKTSEKIEFG